MLVQVATDMKAENQKICMTKSGKERCVPVGGGGGERRVVRGMDGEKKGKGRIGLRYKEHQPPQKHKHLRISEREATLVPLLNKSKLGY